MYLLVGRDRYKVMTECGAVSIRCIEWSCTIVCIYCHHSMVARFDSFATNKMLNYACAIEGAISGNYDMKNYKIDWDCIVYAVLIGCVGLLFGYVAWYSIINGKNVFADHMAVACSFLSVVSLAGMAFLVLLGVERK